MAKKNVTPKTAEQKAAEKAERAAKAASKRQLLAFLEQAGTGDARSVTVRFGYQEGGEFKQFSVWSDGQQKLRYADLSLTSYWDPKSGFSMSSQLRYDSVMTVERRDAELRAKTLRLVEQGLKRLDKEWGYSPDFGTLALRVLKVLKCKELWRLSKTGAVGKYHIANCTDIGYIIGNWAVDWKEASPKVEAE
jgi:hypothetical protein